MGSSETIDIGFGFDANYAPHTASTLASLVRHTRAQRFRFTMLHAGVDREMQRKIESVAPESEYLWREIQDSDAPAMDAKGHINRATLFRLGLEKYAPADCKRILYLDSDLTALRDIRPLWETDLEGRPIAAVVDAYLDPAAFARTWGLSGEDGYFNAGVLLIDLERVRKEKLFTRALELIAGRSADMPYSDQDALNIVFWTRWTRLAPVWNIQRHMIIPEGEHALPTDRQLGQARPGIVHFMGAEKPWLPNTWHPWSWTYWENLQRTPFLQSVADKFGMNAFKRFRLRLRWMRRRPY